MVKYILTGIFIMAFAACAPRTDETGATSASADDFLGRWDVTVRTAEGTYPSWFELYRENGELSGSFVGRVGSARPIPNIETTGNELTFSLPPQYEQHDTDLEFTGRIADQRIEGTTNAADGAELQWTAVPAPELPSPVEPEWGEPIQLFNGRDLTGWKVRDPDAPNKWEAQQGVLVNAEKGVDLITEEEFQDFRLQVEFRYPQGSNSGIYLRGRYEVQIQDDIGKEPSSVYIGGVYGFLTPTKNAAKKADEWQTYDITLLGRWVSIVLNGETVIDRQEIPGITGGALDSSEGKPGPIMIQGDHGPVSFRNIVLTPAK